MPVFYAKINTPKKHKIADFFFSLIPVSTKDLYFGRKEKVIKRKKCFLKILKPSYTAVYKKKNYLGEIIYEDAIKGDIYNNEEYIKMDRLFGSEDTIKELFPVKTEKAYISRKTLKAMFNEYVETQRKKKAMCKLRIKKI